jgi:cell division initiation protein
MFLTPVEIQHQPLRGRRGSYRREDVDRLLERVASSYEQVWLERDRLQERVEQLEREFRSSRELERLLRDGLVAAQRTADELRAEAARESEAVVAEARQMAEDLLGEAQRERDRLGDEIGRLRTQEQETQERYRGLLLAALEVLERERPAAEEAPEPAEVHEPTVALDVRREVDTDPALAAVDQADQVDFAADGPHDEYAVAPLALGLDGAESAPPAYDWGEVPVEEDGAGPDLQEAVGQADGDVAEANLEERTRPRPSRKRGKRTSFGG